MVATVKELAALVRGRLIGDGGVPIQAARPVGEAGPGDITFIEDDRFAKQLRASPASAAIVGPHFKPAGAEEETAKTLIEVDDPLSSFIAVRSHLHARRSKRPVGIHPSAHVAESAQIGPNVAIHPFVFVGEDSVVGEDCTLYPGVVVGDRCRLGTGVILRPNVVLYDDVVIGDRVEVHAGTVLGADGFGYRLKEGRHVKIPQTGHVEIEADVEIGSNCAIDRGTFGPTRIGEGSKIDNLVMIGHNNQLGKHNLVCGQVGIAGSCRIGNYVTLAGQAGIKDHVEIGDRVIVGAQAGVHRNIPGGASVLGSPAIPVKEQRHIFAMIARLPDMHRQLREVASQIALLVAAVPSPGAESRDAPEGF